MGHANIETTMDIYAEAIESKKQEAMKNLSENLDVFWKRLGSIKDTNLERNFFKENPDNLVAIMVWLQKIGLDYKADFNGTE